MPVDEVDAVVDPLVSAYQRSWDRVNAQIGKLADDPLQARKVSRLREVRAAIDREMTYLDKEVATRAYQSMFWTNELGFATGAVSAGAQTVRWDLIDRGAVEKAAGRMYQDLLSATTHVTQTTRGLTNAIANDELLGKLVEGRTAVQAGHRMAQLLEENGVHAVTYANGAKHGLDEYSAMAMRTVSADVYNGSLIEGAVAEDCKWFEIFDGPDCGLEGHDVGDIADGLIVDSQTADTFRISHPNCRRTFGARPDIMSAEQAADASRSTTLAQREDQIRADQVRGLPMSQRGVEAAQPQVRGRPEPPDPHGHRAARAAAQAQQPALTFESVDAAQKYASEVLGSQMSEEDRMAMAFWQSDPRGYQAAARGQDVAGVVAKSPDQVRALDAAVSRGALPEDTVLWRATNHQTFEGDLARLVGGEIRDPGFMATTLHPDGPGAFLFSETPSAGEALLRIRAPAGQQYGTPDGWTPIGWSEVTLPRNTTLKVTGVSEHTVAVGGGGTRSVRMIDAEIG